MTQRDEGHDYRDSKNKTMEYERKQEEILNSFQAWLEKCPVDYDEHFETSDDDITSINFHYKNIWNRKQKVISGSDYEINPDGTEEEK